MELIIVQFFNRLGRGSMDRVTRVISHIFLLAVLWATIGIWILFFDKNNGREIFVAMAVASLMHFAISEGIFKMLLPKFFRGRRRPYVAFPEQVKAIGKEHRDSSFPSSHMSTTSAMLMVIGYFYPILWPVAIIFALFMAYARMHNGMHYPSDIVAGASLGIFYGLVGIYCAKIATIYFLFLHR